MAITEIIERQVVAEDSPETRVVLQEAVTPVALTESPSKVVILEAPDPVAPDGITEELVLTVQESPPIILQENSDAATILNVNQSVVLTTVETRVVIEDAAVGPQGIPGPPGPTSFYAQPEAPEAPPPQHVWIETGLGDGTQFQVWWNDGVS